MGVGHFTSPEGRARFVAAYQVAMRALPEPSGEHDIETGFGCARVYRFGRSPGTPVVLLPGRTGTTAMWAPNIAALAEHHAVYSVDLLGEPGRSVQTVPIRDGRDQARWLGAVLAGLDFEGVHLVGVSIGGWLAFNQALRSPERIVSVSLLDPANVLARFSLRMMLAAVAALPFAPQRAREHFLSWISGDTPVADDDPTARVIAAGMREYKLALPAPAYPSDNDLRSMTVPVLALIGGRSTVHDPWKAVHRARALLPDAEAELWPEASHAISGECAERVNARLRKFIEDIESRW